MTFDPEVGNLVRTSPEPENPHTSPPIVVGSDETTVVRDSDTSTGAVSVVASARTLHRLDYLLLQMAISLTQKDEITMGQILKFSGLDEDALCELWSDVSHLAFRASLATNGLGGGSDGKHSTEGDTTPVGNDDGPWVAGALFDVIPPKPLERSSTPEETLVRTRWYAITQGRQVGITKDAQLAQQSVFNVANSMHSFNGPLAQEDALSHFNGRLALGYVEVVSSSS
ncbi:hypothetical protein C8F01DRAFT_1268132 [Mycena amicta]|nr:hypothetical protein C8F01DRAFT_1268132 [Mycena amicta]